MQLKCGLHSAAEVWSAYATTKPHASALCLHHKGGKRGRGKTYQIFGPPSELSFLLVQFTEAGSGSK